MVTEAVARSLHHVLDALASLNVPSAVMGGIAVAAWNHFRTTKDVDLLVGITDDADSVIEQLADFDIHPKRDPPVLNIESNRFIQFLYEPPDALLDIQLDFLLADSEFQQSALARRVTLRLPALDRDVAVVACEDLLILKLLSGRIIDRADAAALVRINRATLDLDYLDHWIRRLQLGNEFAEIWTEANPDEACPI